MDALQPMFQRNLALANQEGGRFGSANAIMRSRALEDYNLLGAQAAQTGINQQMQAAQIANLLGNTQFGNMVGGYGVGQAQAQQNASAQQQAIQILLQQLGVAQNATLGGPVVTQPGGMSQGAQLGGQLGQLLVMSGLLGGGGGGIPGAPPMPNIDFTAPPPGSY
jgi:hypothetical protein